MRYVIAAIACLACSDVYGQGVSQSVEAGVSNPSNTVACPNGTAECNSVAGSSATVSMKKTPPPVKKPAPKKMYYK